MRALISFVTSVLMLNLSAQAGLEKNTKTKKQKMEESSKTTTKKKKQESGFEYNPRPYSPKSTPQERIQTED